MFGWVVVVPPNVRTGESGATLGAVGSRVVVTTAPLLPLRTSGREFPPDPSWGRPPGAGWVPVD